MLYGKGIVLSHMAAQRQSCVKCRNAKAMFRSVQRSKGMVRYSAVGQRQSKDQTAKGSESMKQADSLNEKRKATAERLPLLKPKASKARAIRLDALILYHGF